MWYYRRQCRYKEYHICTGLLTDRDVVLYRYINCRQAHIAIDGDVALNRHTILHKHRHR
jgi:hypothetical protein